jgi:hypothetical protein
MRFDFSGSQTWKGTLPLGDRTWQIEAWRHYDICGELRYATGWKANAAAQAVMYAAVIDPKTGKAARPADDPKVVAIADSALGGAVKRPANVWTQVLNLECAGEVWVILRAPEKRGNPDEWLVVSSTEIEQQSGRITFKHPMSGEKLPVTGKDLLIRIYRGHPQRQDAADSAVRALLPTLREIEKTSQNIAARLDSRLASAGLLIVPQEADFAQDDGDPEDDGGLVGLFAKTFQAGLSQPGSAAAQVPIIAQVPAEVADAFAKIDFESPLSKEILQLREAAIGRLAAGLDLPREIVEGMGDSNHWSAWQVQETTYTTHLLPVLDLISDALTQAWFTQALTAAGVANPDQYILAFDGSALVGQPDQSEQTFEMLDRGLITKNGARQILNVPDEYAPKGTDEQVALALQLVTGAPSLFENPILQRILGFTPDATPAPAAVEAPAPAAVTDGTDTTPPGPPSRTASIGEADLMVLYALERAGNRLLNTQRMKTTYSSVPRHELHCRLTPDPERHADLLDDAWRHNPRLAADLRLGEYTRQLITRGVPHHIDMLREWVAGLDAA